MNLDAGSASTESALPLGVAELARVPLACPVGSLATSATPNRTALYDGVQLPSALKR
jgi:hypothetical protein